ncbi:charged multivesicular body protein 7 [Neodiprion lecontei]|uniref:Charged multivesicular body protein 7 n=1 Tax=Neodiprion lecontei TaxID=441921 RepID=A0A6J0C3H2_NEOLC|nr:charged multivesicular body protein 7 [Neodiprion lecontei]
MQAQQDLNESLPLPAEEMPECWERDDRMNSLFAQFRNRSANPQDWDSKYRFWRGLIADWSKYRKRCSFSLSDLNKAFKRNGRSPACLSIVLQELHRNGEIVPMLNFIRESPNSWGGWAVDTLVKRPLFWSFSVLKNSIVETSVDPETRYVHLETVKELGELILSTIKKNEENTLFSMSDITKNCIEKVDIKKGSLSDDDVKLAMIWLRLNKKAAFHLSPERDSNDTLVKLSNTHVKEVTEAEEGLYQLEKQEETLIKNLELLEMEKETVIKNAKAYLANGMRQVAKSCLRKKKELEKSIEKRAAAIQNIQIIITRVRDMRSDSEVLNSYKAGAAALKQKLAEDGLNEDNVADTMNDLSEVLEEFSEMQSVLTKPVDYYDSDLEDELTELLAESEHDDSINNPENNSGKSQSNSNVNGDKKQPNIDKEFSSLRLEDLPPPPTKYSPSIKSPVPSGGE